MKETFLLTPIIVSDCRKTDMCILQGALLTENTEGADHPIANQATVQSTNQPAEDRYRSQTDTTQYSRTKTIDHQPVA